MEPPGYTINLSRILEHLPMRAEAFDLVAVADTDRHGTVIAQEGETTLKRQHLERLVDADSKLPISTAALWQSSLASNVTIGGVAYKLFSRPVSYPHFTDSTMLFVSALGATGVSALARLAGTVKAMASVATPSARANG
ncbi:MAG TPA: hypothetical protein VGN09_14415 [Vicinamibacteria bacterium]